MRSGTLPTPLCVGLGEACRIAEAEMAVEAERLRALRRHMLAALQERVPDVVVNGDLARRIPGNLNLGFAGVDAEALMNGIPDVALSTGSACSSAALEPSYVLRALGVSDDLARCSIRIGLGRFTTAAEVDHAVDRLAQGVARLRETASAT